MKKNKVVIVTMNPSLDRVLLVDKVAPGAIHRSKPATVSPGGKGLNVCRTIQTLLHQISQNLELFCTSCNSTNASPSLLSQFVNNVSVENTGILAGDAGKYLEKLATAQGMHGNWWWIPAISTSEEELDTQQTRTCVLVSGTSQGDSTVFNEEGPTITQENWNAFSGHLLKSLSPTFSTPSPVPCEKTVLVISGSVPPGVHPKQFSELVSDLSQRHFVFIDTSKAYLKEVVNANPSNVVVKVNLSEISEILNMKEGQLHEGQHLELVIKKVQESAFMQQSQGNKWLIITLGSDGAVLITKTNHVHIRAPQLESLVSTVGSGDAFLGSLVFYLLFLAATSHQSLGNTEEQKQSGSNLDIHSVPIFDISEKLVEVGVKFAVAGGSANALNSIPGFLEFTDMIKYV